MLVNRTSEKRQSKNCSNSVLSVSIASQISVIHLKLIFARNFVPYMIAIIQSQTYLKDCYTDRHTPHVPSGIVLKDSPTEQTQKEQASSIANRIWIDRVRVMMEIVKIDDTNDNGSVIVIGCTSFTSSLDTKQQQIYQFLRITKVYSFDYWMYANRPSVD